MHATPTPARLPRCQRVPPERGPGCSRWAHADAASSPRVRSVHASTLGVVCLLRLDKYVMTQGHHQTGAAKKSVRFFCTMGLVALS